MAEWVQRVRVPRWHVFCRRLTMVAVLVVPTTGSAHAPRLEIALWGGGSSGNFPDGDAARCQRAIGHAVARCAQEAWATRNACRRLQLVGQSCDMTATDAAISAAHDRAVAFIGAGCSDAQAVAIGFFGVSEAQANLTTSCQTFEQDLAAAVYGSEPVGDSAVLVDDQTTACVRAAARATTAVVRVALSKWVGLLDRIATGDDPPSRKVALVKATAARITQARLRLTQSVAASCAEADFLSVYRETVDAFLQGVAPEADCVVGSGYVQSAVFCP